MICRGSFSNWNATVFKKQKPEACSKLPDKMTCFMREGSSSTVFWRVCHVHNFTQAIEVARELRIRPQGMAVALQVPELFIPFASILFGLLVFVQGAFYQH